MRDPTFKRWQKEHLHDPHVADLNAFVDELAHRKGDFVPHVSPEFGGVNARVLFLLLSPGVRTYDDNGAPGSGFLSVENTDDAAWRIADAMDAAELDVTDCVGWNVYPWFVKGMSSFTQRQRRPYLEEGSELLIHLIARLPELRSVLVFGDAPDLAWKAFGQKYPRTRRSLKYFHHRSTGPQGYLGTADQQSQWRQDLVEQMKLAKSAATGPARIQ